MNKKLLSILTLTLCIGLSSQMSFAERECDRGYLEPNNTFDQATTISRNNSEHPDVMYEYYLGSLEPASDIDFFSVSLPAGDNTLIVQPYRADLHVELFDSNKNRVHREIFTKRNMQSELNLDEAGLYYIRIAMEPGTQPDPNQNPSYRLLIGNPYYEWGSFTYSGISSTTITPWRKTSAIREFDLSNNSSIPDDACVDNIRIGGRESERVYGRVRSVKPLGHYKWFDCREFWFGSEDVSAVMPIRMKQRWQFKHYADTFYSTKSYTLKPEIYFRYYNKQNLDE